MAALNLGDFSHEYRADRAAKNLLWSQAVSAEFVTFLVLFARGDVVTCEAHHSKAAVQVWILKPVVNRTQWYVKCYFSNNLMFISVHR